MKDSKFIELLNLYVDQQIDPADAALLEEEILHHPGRRRTYQQYCRMHRGCVMLQEQSRPQVGVGEKFTAAVAAADEKVIEFPPAGPNYAKRFYFAGLAAAAACIAFALVSRQSWKSHAVDVVAVPDQVVQIAPAPAAKPSMVSQAINYQPVLVAQHTLRLNSIPTNADLATTAGTALGWMTQVQLAPLPQATPAVDFTFENPASVHNGKDLFRSTLLPVQEPTEKAAYQFQR